MHDLKIILIIISAFFGVLNFHSQNITQVIHSSGTQNYNGIDITVTSEGGAGIWTTYCPSITFPYLIGHDFIANNDANGSYIFQFTPAVESIVLNFSAIGTIQPNDIEIVKVSVNNFHHPLFNLGEPNSCDSIALINADGDLINEPGKPSGLKNIYIAGPISTIKITDSIVSHLPGGSMFSLYFSKLNLSGLDNIDTSDIKVYPNPASEKLYLDNIQIGITEVKVFNIVGEFIPIEIEIMNNMIVIELSVIEKGIYNLQIFDGQSIKSKRIMIE